MDCPGKATTSPAINPAAPDQANTPQDSQAYLKAILEAVQDMSRQVAKLRQAISKIGKP